jgi:thiol:disulfide interchange protein DsbD
VRIILITVFAFAAAHAPAGAPALHVQASLIAGGAGGARGAPVWVGLKLRHEAGWHTYWKNPGDAGMPTRIEWTLPEGWTAGGIEWPAPERLQIGPLGSYGYEGEVVLPVKLFPPAGWDAKSAVQIGARASWLVCKEQCIPESASVSLSLSARNSEADRSLFELWRLRVPKTFHFTAATAVRNQGRLVLSLAPAGDGQFFPDREELVEPGDPPQVAVNGERVTWSARLGAQGKSITVPASIAGVWVPKSGKPVFVAAVLK